MRLKYSKLSHFQTDRLTEQFVAGTPARTAAALVGVNKISATNFYHKLREVIYDRLLEEAGELAGEVEVDESYFGGVRKGKRGRGAAGKTVVFGLLKRGGKVFTMAVKDTKSDTLIPIIACKVQPDSIVYTDSYCSYDVLDITDFHHFRINHSKLFADRHNHINPVLSLSKGVSKTFGTRQKDTCENITASPKRTSISFSKSASGGSIMVRQTSP